MHQGHAQQTESPGAAGDYRSSPEENQPEGTQAFCDRATGLG
jgi:hypothetical protein